MVEPTDTTPTAAQPGTSAASGERRLKVLITAKKRAWCGELYTTVIGANGLAARGHDVTVAHNIGSSIVGRLDRDAVTVEEVDFQRGTRHWPAYFRTAGRLRDLVRTDGIDIVEAHASWDHWLCAVALSRLRQPPPLLRFRHNRKEIKRHAPNRWLYARATNVFAAQTEYVREDILRTGFVPDERVHVLGSAVDLARFRPDPATRDRTRAALGVPDEAKIVGYVGRLSERKRPARVVEIHRLLAAARPDTHLVVVGWGEPPHGQTMKDAAAADSRVHFLGRKGDPESYYPAFDVFVLPSYAESFPRAVLEAMACGVPAVTGHDSGLRGFITDGVSGRVLADDGPHAFAEAVTELFEHPERAAAMGARGMELVRDMLDPDAYVDRLEALMLRTVAGHRAASSNG